MRVMRFGLLALLAASAASAMTFVKAPDSYLVDHAAVIARARVLSAEAAAGGGEFPVTRYALEVTAGLRGAAPGQRLELEVPGGVDRSGVGAVVFGAPRLAPGEEALFFLEPARGGRWRLLHFQQGLFRLGAAGERAVAWRGFEEANEIVAEGAPAMPEPVRDLGAFERWIRDRVAGGRTEAAYELTPAPGEPILVPRFNILRRGDLLIRWPKAAGRVDFTVVAHQTPQPGLASGGYAEVQTALAAWTDLDGGHLRLRYGGTTSAVAGFHNRDGINAIVFDNFGDAADGPTPFDCVGQHGALAYGLAWVSGTHFYGGQEFFTIVEGDSVVNKDSHCWSRFSSLNFERTMTHELGHILGLGHSCGDEGSGPCDTAEKNDAIMRSFNGGDNRGARLGEDDRKAIAFLYGPPAPPADFAAEPDGRRIRLFWADTPNESGYRLFRQGPGGTVQLAELSAGASSFTDDGVEPATTYRYQLRGFNESGVGDAAETEITSADTNVPAQLAAQAGPDFLSVTWSDQSSQEHGYEVWGHLFGNDELLATAPANATGVTLTGLVADSAYTLKVRATGLPYGNTAFTPPLVASTLPAPIGPCTAGDAATCLGAERFKVEVRWKDFAGQRGQGKLAPAGSADSGVFYFFSPSNWEMLVKVLDGCAINQHHWVFAAATTTVELTLIVTDSQTGKTAVYWNPLGQAAPAVTDIGAFACAGASSTSAPAGSVPASGPATVQLRPRVKAGEPAPCQDGDTKLCLLAERFEVTATWQDFQGQSDSARVVPAGSADSGLFYFFSPSNWEMLVKVLDGCALNEKVWVFAAATTNVAYTLMVKDTMTGQIKTYENPLGHPSVAIADVAAFASCPP